MAKKSTETSTPEVTPLMRQYNAIKIKYPGALLLFRVGDFYETFGEDAITASKILGIVLTKRGNGSATEIELAGFPHHSIENYLPKLVRAGQRVAICDQLEDPKSVKGIVKRGVTELVTPGVAFHDHVLDRKQNNYLASIHIDAAKETFGIAFLDISTGQFLCTQGSWQTIEKMVQGFAPSEIIFNKTHKAHYVETLGESIAHYALEDWVWSADYAQETLTAHFGTQNLKGFGIEAYPKGVIAAGACLHYLKATEHHQMQHIGQIQRLDESQYVWLDRFTIRNLELVQPMQEGSVPLIQILDKTITPMGARLMRHWILLPLVQVAAIEQRLEAVAYLSKNQEVCVTLQTHLQSVGDLERMISKVSARRIGPRELYQLYVSLQQLEPIQKLFLSEKGRLGAMAQSMNLCLVLQDRISTMLKKELPLLANQGGMMADGIDAELDELRKIAFSGKDYLLEITQREIDKTGISSLKIHYNKVFGYFLEVTNTHKDKVPVDWIRKQTTVNSERYITEELKIYEEKILTAEDKIFAIEFRLFQELVEETFQFIQPIQDNARKVAEFDYYQSMAVVAKANGYCRPSVNENWDLHIKEGRHPVIECQLPTGEMYVPNDTFFDAKQQIIIITGPNMAGKSALLRQTALITLMAQIGSFVPASKADIGVVDKIFTRVGASDNLSKGESTFMVEMTETASILNNLSHKSLILMDEIGRGTSTYDGISIAWSIVEYLHQHPNFQAKTLFATHYHELNILEEQFDRIQNYHVSVKEVNQKILFLRKLTKGGSEHSFGIHVAQIAGMPNQIVLRAYDLMQTLEKQKEKDVNKDQLRKRKDAPHQLHIFETADPRYKLVKEMVQHIDINQMSPLDALIKLQELKGMMG